MHDLDDRPLVRPPLAADINRGPPRSARSHVPIIIIAVVGLVAGGFGAWWWSRGRHAPAAGPVTAASEATIAGPAKSSRPLPPLDEMDTFLRALLGALSSHPELARWLATDNLIRQLANGIDHVSRGASPAPDLRVLRPQGIFEVSRGRDRMAIDPKSYRRYDGLAAAMASLDARAAAEAYRALGRTEGGVDQAVSVALQVLIDTPQVTEPVRVVPGPGATYAYADDDLEALHPVQKQLLRMGPANLARVQTRLREIKAAIETRAQ